jgi:hypothetical protein
LLDSRAPFGDEFRENDALTVVSEKFGKAASHGEADDLL